MKRIALAVVFSLALGAQAQNQTCLPGYAAPSAPPRPASLNVNWPAVDGGSITLADGGTFACVGYAPGGPGASNPYGSTPAKCATARAMADLMVAKDNGWDDGGIP